jgi:hypothetical protein
LIWFVANVGGILGLTMGCSLVTIFEILHHVVICFVRTGVRSLTTMRRTLHKSTQERQQQEQQQQQLQPDVERENSFKHSKVVKIQCC